MNRVTQKLIRLAFVSLVGLSVASCSSWVEGAHDWALTSIDGNVLSVVVAVGSGSCDRFQAIEVSETQTEVDITALVSEKEPGGLFTTGCTADMGFKHVKSSWTGQSEIGLLLAAPPAMTDCRPTSLIPTADVPQTTVPKLSTAMAASADQLIPDENAHI